MRTGNKVLLGLCLRYSCYLGRGAGGLFLKTCLVTDAGPGEGLVSDLGHACVSRGPLSTEGGTRVPRGRIVTWLILPVVICLSQRLSHACLSINKFVL